MTLSKKLHLAFLAVTILPLAAVLAVLYFTSIRHAEALVGARFQDNVAQAAQTLDQFALNCVRDMHACAGSPIFQCGTPDQIRRRLAGYAAAYPYLGQRLLCDTNGVIVASSHAPDVGQSLFARFDHLRDDLEQTLGSPPGPVFVSDLADAPAAQRAPDARGAL